MKTINIFGEYIEGTNSEMEADWLMPKKLIREIAKKYGYQRLRNYRQWDDVHFSAEVNGIVIVVNIESCELYERNPFTKKLMKQKVR